MFTYIYLIAQDAVIHCVDGVNCISMSTSHFTWLLSIGALEIVFELAGVAKIFKLKDSFSKEEKEKLGLKDEDEIS